MPDVYKQSFKQNYTNNIELSIFNCGLGGAPRPDMGPRHPGPLPDPPCRFGQGHL